MGTKKRVLTPTANNKHMRSVILRNGYRVSDNEQDPGEWTAERMDREMLAGGRRLLCTTTCRRA